MYVHLLIQIKQVSKEAFLLMRFFYLTRSAFVSNGGQGLKIIVEPFTCGDNWLSCLGFPDKCWKVNIVTHWSLNNCLITLESSAERERELRRQLQRILLGDFKWRQVVIRHV